MLISNTFANFITVLICGSFITPLSTFPIAPNVSPDFLANSLKINQ